jgi:hypothetical protein
MILWEYQDKTRKQDPGRKQSRMGIENALVRRMPRTVEGTQKSKGLQPRDGFEGGRRNRPFIVKVGNADGGSTLMYVDSQGSAGFRE